MSRIGTITIACAVLLLSATAAGWSWQVGTRLTLVTSDGARIVGIGEIGDLDLRLTLARGYSGLAVLVAEGPAGTLETFDVLVEEDGSVLLGEDGEYSELGEAARHGGLAYRVVFEDGHHEEEEQRARMRPASVSPSELAEYVEHQAAAQAGSASAAGAEREARGEGEASNELGAGEAVRDRGAAAAGAGKAPGGAPAAAVGGNHRPLRQGGERRAPAGPPGWGPGWD